MSVRLPVDQLRYCCRKDIAEYSTLIWSVFRSSFILFSLNDCGDVVIARSARSGKTEGDPSGVVLRGIASCRTGNKRESHNRRRNTTTARVQNPRVKLIIRNSNVYEIVIPSSYFCFSLLDDFLPHTPLNPAICLLCALSPSDFRFYRLSSHSLHALTLVAFSKAHFSSRVFDNHLPNQKDPCQSRSAHRVFFYQCL